MKSLSLKPRRLILASMVFSVMVAALFSAGSVASSKSGVQKMPTRDAQVSEMAHQHDGTRDFIRANSGSLGSIAFAVAGESFDVDRFDDNAAATACDLAVANDCSLRGAIIRANSTTGATINLPAGTYVLNTLNISGDEDAAGTGDLDVRSSSTEIKGVGAASTVIQQTVVDRVFEINPTNTNDFIFKISDVTITGGNLGSGAGGGMNIVGVNSSTTITNCIFDNNKTTGTFIPNGGAISVGNGNLTISGTTFKNNSTQSGNGGAIRFNSPNTLTVTGSSFTGNKANTNSGGAINALGGVFNISKSSFEGNQASGTTGQGGAVFVGGTGVLNLSYSRLVGNTSTTNGTAVALATGSTGSISAEDNWWGANSGPAGGSINVGVSRWLQLRFNDASVQAGGSVNLTADILGRNSGGPIAAANLVGLPLFPSTPGTIFSNPAPQLGNLSSASTQFVNGQATATYTASSQTGVDDVIASADSQLQSAKITITEPPIQFAINDSSVVRPTSGNVSMLFTVTLTQPAQSMVTVAYQTANDSGGANPGVAGTDYMADSGTVTFNAGEQFKVIAITIPSNPSASGDKTFLVNLSSPSQGTILDGQAKGTIKATRAQSIALITEVRTSGPAGADDDFVEVYNNTDSPINVASTDGSAGWAVVKMGASCSDAPVIVGTIPNGTIIPARGHYLFVGTSYSLGGYAPGDSTLSINIDSDANLALFTVADLAKLSADNKLDGVGFGTNTGGICDLLRNGDTLPVALGSTAEHSYVRKDLWPIFDTGDNQDDFKLVAVSQAATIGSGTAPVLGAPGPQNLQSPVARNGYLTPGLISPGLSADVAPNRVRVQGPYNYTDPITSQSITFPSGTIAVRRSYKNNTGQNMTALRFRIVIITAGGPIPAGNADVRAISSLPEIVNVNGSNITVQGTTLQQLPNQPEGGGINATMGCCRLTGGTVAGERTVSLAQPLAPGQTISLQWLLGVMQKGNFQFYVNIEGLP